MLKKATTYLNFSAKSTREKLEFLKDCTKVLFEITAALKEK